MSINRETLDAVFTALDAATIGPWKTVGSTHCNGVGGDFDSLPGAFKLVCGDSTGADCDAVVAAVNWLRENRSALTAQPPAAPGIDLEQFRRAVQFFVAYTFPGTPSRNDANRLLALIDASPKGGSMSDCPIIRLAPGEYTDWEKRVWRRGVIECATQSDIAAAMQPTSHGAGVSCE